MTKSEKSAGASRSRASRSEKPNDKQPSKPVPSRRSPVEDRKSPRRHTANNPKKKSWFKRGLMGLLWLFLIGVILGGITVIASFILIDVPKVDDAVRQERTVVTYADGKTEMGSLSKINRKIIDTSKIPAYVGQAVVASEDRTFFKNNGVDLKGIVRAFWNNIRGGSRQGASTLTQQYVENYYTGSRGGYIGKYREAILALKINQSQTKQEILNNYLNTIYFGRSAYGIEAAANAYFNKSAKDLTVSEAALIAGIIPAPSKWDPAKNPEQAKKRWERVIALMKEDGWISEQQAKEAQFPKFVEKYTYVRRSGNSGYLLDQAEAEAVRLAGLKENDLQTGGYRVVTTIDKNHQEQMAKAIAEMPEGAAPNLRVGMISVNSTTGAILAEFPGKDYGKSQRNIVTEDILHAGSTFKPFALMAALEDGRTLYSKVNGNSPAYFPGGYVANNFGGYSYGVVTLRKATAMSINTAYLRLNRQIGPEKTKEMAIRMGIPADTVGLDENLVNVLGPASVHLADLAQAYSTLGNYGAENPVHIVAEIRDSKGQVVYKAPQPNKQVLPANTAKQTLKAMQDVVAYGSGEDARIRGWKPAGKTGTSQENKSALFVGLVPGVTTVIGMFQEGPGGAEETITPFGGFREITGGSVPTRVWKAYMEQALEGVEPTEFEEPERPIKVRREPVAPQPEEQEEETPEETKEAPKEEPAPAQPEQPAPAPSEPAQPEQPKPQPEEPKQPAPGDQKQPEKPQNQKQGQLKPGKPGKVGKNG
ncbi:hypothetical protein BSR28_02415 [Boudabousia liubingyangii]|uniref:transglycosylase domain-containing protein n=1 Tax=Boudabousia liubingyangii TaxID=1921764 RepID=UPI0009402D02|nr:transglycosylase domain-containing protein [Boudabousia liubingyangii]OKL48555.1 hypothetical protein BSR28_02415 [Boudabousia liubingyangii]